MGNASIENSNARTDNTRKVNMKLQTLPTTWQEAASTVLIDATREAGAWLADGPRETARCHEEILNVFEQLVDDVFHPDSNENEVLAKNDFRKRMFNVIAVNGIIGYAQETEVSVEEAGMHVLKTIIGKQRMYGHGNIARFGVPGLAIRLNDKLERLKNLQKHDGPVLFEPRQDTWLDICGYSAISLMWLNDWFLLELTADF